VEAYRTEEEQVEALKRWWNENGKSTVAAVIIAVSLGVVYQAWKGGNERASESASDMYQVMLQAISGAAEDVSLQGQVSAIGEQLKSEHDGSVYAQFAALHLARLAVDQGDLQAAEAELRWVLGKADKGSDTGQLAQLRLARVLAASGDIDQAMAILESGSQGDYEVTYAAARGDILLSQGNTEGARQAYTEALSLAGANPGQLNLRTLQQKLQSLSPVPARELKESSGMEPRAEARPAGQATEGQ
jgi:predicted negative regulator of RcsB-dependent stress response